VPVLLGEDALCGFLEAICVSLIVCQLGHRSSISESRVLPVPGFSIGRVLLASVLGTIAGVLPLYIGVPLNLCPTAGAVVTGIVVALAKLAHPSEATLAV
jgi:hypothetical protein